ncbi:hypothetical protein VaNZ11_015358 [Volvox africanus]|uniref:RRM domain-containing protein n=1 Tax=Volvox africanus TaxID=51714 RepID=A0ABQ5SLQ0_9CHLO|nr:hypothetical protein VaNZ11_015358 [Volvox africanus]
MSGDSALEHSSTNGSKRRRTITGDGDAPAAKKSFTDAEIAAEVALSLHIREQRRAEVRSIYLNYGTLLKGSETGSEALAFQGLLDCANGSLGARRLAARLVPRFLPRFPSHAEQAFRLLSSLYGDGQPPRAPGGLNGYVTSSVTTAEGTPRNAGPAAVITDGCDDSVDLEEAMRRDALRGLGNVLEAAAAARQIERNVPVVMELVLFLMRHMRRLQASSSGSGVGRGSGGGASDTALKSLKAAGSAPPPKPPQSPKAPETQLPKLPEPQQPKQLSSDQNVSVNAMLGHGLKHRYIRRNAEAAANAEANGGGPWRARSANRCPSDDEGGRSGRAAQHSPTPPPASVAPFSSGAQTHEGTDRCGKVGGGDETENGPGAGKGNSAPAGVPIDLAATQDPDSDVAVIRSLLCRTFAMFPRVVLTASLQPFRLPTKQRGHEDCEVCGQLLELLLQPAPASEFTKSVAATVVGLTTELTEAVNEGGGGGSSGMGNYRGCNIDGEGAAGSNAAAGDAAALGPGRGPSSADGTACSSCLAARVLAQLPETQTWFRQLATAIMQGKTQHSLPSSVQGLLERLLQYCTASVVPAAAALGKVSPRASPHGAVAATGGTGVPCGGSVNLTSTRQGPVKPDAGPASTAAHSMVGSDDNSRSVPMDLDHSISTAVIRPEGSGAVTTPNVAGAGAAAAAALAGPQDTAATPAPPPLLPPQHSSYPQHHHLQNDGLLAGQAAGPATVPAGAVPPQPHPLPPPPPLPSLSLYLNRGSSGLRGGPVCRAEACLYIGGLPPGLTEAALFAELSRLGNVESVHPFDQQQVLQQHPVHGCLSGPQVPLGEEVYVVFMSLRDAAICYEAVARTCLFGGTRPLVVEFCSAFPADSPAARRCVAAAAMAAAGGGGTSSTASEFVWVSLSASAAVTPESVVTALQAASIPVPQQILQVAGRAPGMLLHMASAASVPQVAACLQAHFVHPPLPPPPSVTTSAATSSNAGISLPPPPVMAAAQTVPSGAGGHYSTPLYMQQASAGGSSVDSCNFRTIWIGQLHESVREEELLAACRVHGDVVGHRLLRTSHCAFVDFASQAGAEAAKRALHGTRLGPQHIRVEWKLDTSLSSRAPLTLRHGSAPLPGNASGNHVPFGLGSGAPGLVTSPSCAPGIGLPGSAGHSLAGQGLPQPSPAAAGMGMMGQHMTPQAMAAANVAAAAAAAAARGTFAGSCNGTDRWAPVVMPLAPTNAATPSPAAAPAGNTGPVASGGSGFLTSNQVPLQSPVQSQQHLPVGPFGTGVMNATVAVAARPTAPMLIPHQQILAGLGGGVMLAHGMVLQHQGSSFTTQQQAQLLHTHATAPSGSGGGALTHAPLPSQPHTPVQLPVHLQPMGGYPGPPPLQQPQGPLGLHGHSTAPMIVSHQHALGIGGPSPQHPTQQQHPQHAHGHPPGQLQQQRPSDWPQHGQGVTAGGTHSTASPGLPGPGGTLAQLQRFELGTGPGMPLPNSPPMLLDGMTAVTASGGGAPVAGPPPQALPHAHSQHTLPQAKQGPAQQHGSAPIHIQQPHLHTHAHTPHQQLPPPPPLQQLQQQQSHHLFNQQQQQLTSPPSVTWQGGLAKSGSLVCTLQCITGGANAAGATPGEREPVTWPATLDVKLRVDLSYVIHSLYSHTTPHARAMRRLVTAGGADQRTKLSDFMTYLLDKNRAGVIKLEAAAGLPPRTLYLVPPSEQVCAALGAEWTAGEPFLLALVVPTASGTTGANKG